MSINTVKTEKRSLLILIPNEWIKLIQLDDIFCQVLYNPAEFSISFKLYIDIKTTDHDTVSTYTYSFVLLDKVLLMLSK